MNEMNEKERKNCYLDTIVDFAIVIGVDLIAVDRIMQDLAYGPCMDVIYQKVVK